MLANGGDTLAVSSGATRFEMQGKVPAGTAYAITVQAQPSGQTCSVASGSGTMPSANVANVVVTCATNAYNLGGSISGLTTSGLVLANGGDTLTVPAGATRFTLPAAVAYASSFDVTVQTQPAGQSCAVTNGSGQMGAGDLSNVTVSCSSLPYNVGGTISGLTTSGLVLANGSDSLAVAANSASFTLPTAVAHGGSYAVTVQNQPAGLTCSVASGSGTINAADVANVAVTCAANSYSVGGTISGLTSGGLVLANGADTLSVASGAGSFELALPVAYGGTYAVTVRTQPTGLTCSVADGSDTMGAGNVTNVAVTCATNSYTLGGSISGLTNSGLVLRNGGDTLTVMANASNFTMTNSVAYGGSYALTVQTQPTGLTCSVASGSGTMPAANVLNAVVTCSANAYTLGGSISGLTTAGLVLGNGAGNTVTVPANATSFTLPVSVAFGSSYNVTVRTQPAGQSCGVTNGGGQMGAGNVTSVTVSCSSLPYNVGGTISGLTTPGLVLRNGSDTLTVAANASSFTMPAQVAHGGAYAVAVQTQPTGLTCSVANGSGTINAAPVTNVAVTCAANSYTVGGAITGLNSGGLVLRNGGSTLTVAANASSYTLPGTVAYGGAYAVTVQTQPTGLTCSVANGSGTMGAGNVTNVGVTCSANSYTLGGTITGLTGSGLVLANGGDSLSVAANAGNFTMTNSVAFGGSYAVTVQASPIGLTCSVANGSGTMGAGDVSSVTVSCAASAATVSTLAGSGSAGHDDGIGIAATFSHPTGVAVNSSGTEVYVADFESNSIRKIITATGVVTTFAGSTAGDADISIDGNGTDARFNRPYQLALDAGGNLYVTDYNNHTLRKITPAGVVSTLAGSGTAGSADGTGAAASFNFPAGLAVEPGGTAYVADYLGHTIRKITPAGVVTTLAGSGSPGNADGVGTAASFTNPVGMLVSGGTLYVADSNNNTIRMIDTTTGQVTTWAGSGSAGSDDGTGTAATFNAPHALARDASGNIYVSDWAGQKIRQITSAGVVTTLAGTGAVGSGDGAATAATFSSPTGVTVDASGTLYVADYGNHKIRKIAR